MKTLILALVLFTASASQAGVSVRGGGDEVGLDFLQAYNRAVTNIRKNSFKELEKVTNIDISARLPKLQILVVEEVLPVNIGGVVQESTAVNYPSRQLIQINRPRWKQLNNDHLKESLALHEVLSLLGLESTGVYTLTSQYASRYGLSEKDLLGSSPTLGYVCKVVKSSLKITGGPSSEARRRFAKLTEVTVFNQAELTSGFLEKIQEGILEFKPYPTSVMMKATQSLQYITQQQTRVLDLQGQQVLKEDTVPDEFINEYKHVFQINSATKNENLNITIRHRQSIDHWEIESGNVDYNYADPTGRADGTMTAKLNCPNLQD